MVSMPISPIQPGNTFLTKNRSSTNAPPAQATTSTSLKTHSASSPSWPPASSTSPGLTPPATSTAP
jgi:hypothetical protein